MIRHHTIPRTRSWLTGPHSACECYELSSDDIQALSADEHRAYIVWCLFEHAYTFEVRPMSKPAKKVAA